jgi:hypothetical protein
MRIQKNFVMGTLEVAPDEGRLWLKTQNCNLRVSKLSFKNVEESFSMIDIQGGQAVMVPEAEEYDETMLNFVGSICSCVQAESVNREMKGQDKQEFLDHILKAIQGCVSTFEKGKGNVYPK